MEPKSPGWRIFRTWSLDFGETAAGWMAAGPRGISGALRWNGPGTTEGFFGYFISHSVRRRINMAAEGPLPGFPACVQKPQRHAEISS